MFALIYANGGPDTTKGSLMEKYGVNLTLHREDSNSQMKADLLACAKQLHDGEKTCSSGAEAHRGDGRQRRPVAGRSESATEEAGAGVSGGDHRRGGPLQRRGCAARPGRVEVESAEHEGQDRGRRHSRRRLEYRPELSWDRTA